MKALEEKIIKEGKVFPGNILNVGSFLNQKLDVNFLLTLGEEIHRLFKSENIDTILTIEASGIAVATAAATYFRVPVVFAKKSASANQTNEKYTAKIHSYTHGNDYIASISKEYLNSNNKVLIIDDFLANGEAMEGLISIVSQSSAALCGCCSVIEKGFQGGGDRLRSRGIKVESLAIIDSMDVNNGIKFR